MGEMRNAYKAFVRKPEGTKSFGRSRRRWADNMRMDIREIRWETVEWILLAQDRDQWQAFVNTIMNLRVHERRINFLTS
jgi:hypothetical protein